MQQSETRNADVIYDAFADHYRSYSEQKAAYIKAIDDLIVERFSTHVASVLDFGAGDGHRGATLFKCLKAKTLIQADISSEMVRKCENLGVASQVLDTKEEGWKTANIQADMIVALWNVIGHIPTTDQRIETLKTLRRLLTPGGVLCFDVNNRHYSGYGKWSSAARRIWDWISPDFSRGDVEFTWSIDGVDYPASGHFFTHAEVRHLLAQAGFALEEYWAVDYLTGKKSRHTQDGQLLFFAKPN